MSKRTALALILFAVTSACPAEPRWCSVVGRDPSNIIVYPPIARAARVSGVVLAHIIYVPNGKVEEVQPISGPILLSRSLTDQLMKWRVKTDAQGDAPCVTLVIADFSFSDSSPPTKLAPTPPSIFRIAIEAQILIISDPAAEYTRLPSLRRLMWHLKRLFSRGQ
ncbi:MAG: hypothetical protein KGL64_04090 [Acidobacteriota bacterium]|nr:hypothetical protein [Acidobacteriota bacterium]